MTVTRHHRRRSYRTVRLPLRSPFNVHLQRKVDVEADVMKVKVKRREGNGKR